MSSDRPAVENVQGAFWRRRQNPGFGKEQEQVGVSGWRGGRGADDCRQ